MANIDKLNIAGTIYDITPNKLATARTITIGAAGKSFDGSANISYNAYEMKLTRALFSTDTNLNDFAERGNAIGMCHLADNGSIDNPGGKTGWHHVFQATWNDAGENNGSTTNEWCTQIANVCGTTDLYVRSRSGGEIVDGTAWVAPWAKILTERNNGWTLDGMINKTQSSTVNNVVKLSHTTTKWYPEVWVIFSMNDSDNNNDNFCTCNSGSLQSVIGKRTYDSSGFNSWKSRFESMSGLTLTTTNYPFSYNFTWFFYRKNVPAGTTIEIQKNQYGRDMFMAVIGGGDGSGGVPVWAYMS